jgi:hypothetical protein
MLNSTTRIMYNLRTDVDDRYNIDYEKVRINVLTSIQHAECLEDKEIRRAIIEATKLIDPNADGLYSIAVELPGRLILTNVTRSEIEDLMAHLYYMDVRMAGDEPDTPRRSTRVGRICRALDIDSDYLNQIEAASDIDRASKSDVDVINRALEYFTISHEDEKIYRLSVNAFIRMYSEGEKENVDVSVALNPDQKDLSDPRAMQLNVTLDSTKHYSVTCSFAQAVECTSVRARIRNDPGRSTVIGTQLSVINRAIEALGCSVDPEEELFFALGDTKVSHRVTETFTVGYVVWYILFITCHDDYTITSAHLWPVGDLWKITIFRPGGGDIVVQGTKENIRCLMLLLHLSEKVSSLGGRALKAMVEESLSHS